jgi:tetratricopeptide (TPR) repeat protein
MSWRQRILIALAGLTLLVGGSVFYMAGKVDELIAQNGASGAFLAARHAARNHDSDAASAYYDRALVARPKSLPLLQAGLQAHLLAGRIDEAARAATALIGQNPKHQQARILLAIRAFKRADEDTALSHLDALDNGPFAKLLEPNIRIWLARQNDDRDAEAAALTQLMRGGPFTHVSLMQAAHVHELNGDNASAHDAYRQALRSGGARYLQFVLAYGGFLERLQDWEKAEQLYTYFQDRNLDNALISEAFARIDKQTPARLTKRPVAALAEAFASIGESMAAENRSELALGYYRMSLFLTGGDDATVFHLAALLADLERHIEAAEQYGLIDDGSVLYRDAQIQRAQMLYLAGADAAAIAVLHARAEDMPDDRDIHISLGDLYRSNARFEEAEAAYDRAIALTDKVRDRDWFLFFARGMMRERLGNWDAAELDLQRARKMSGDAPNVLNYLGYSWIDQGIYLDEGLKIIQKAVKKEPDNGAYVDSLGWAYYRLGNYKLALPLLERASRLEPTDPVVTDHLGDVMWRLGRELEARYQWRKALAFEPTEKDRAKIEEKLLVGLGPPEKKNPKAHMPRGGTAI